eukprot:6023569-Pyramimonas_sp.AAC.1
MPIGIVSSSIVSNSDWDIVGIQSGPFLVDSYSHPVGNRLESKGLFPLDSNRAILLVPLGNQ